MLALLFSTSTGSALWENHLGSDYRPSHCVPVEDPRWSEPRLEFFDPWQEDNYTNNPPNGIWVLDQSQAPWLDTQSDILVMLSNHGLLRIYDNKYKLNEEVETDILWAAELMDVDDTGGLHLMVPSGLGHASHLYDLKAEQIRSYEPDALVPGALELSGSTVGFPALGDFTGNGTMELVFGGRHQWHAYASGGEMIAQKPVVDPYNRPFATTVGHTEDDADYIYMATMHHPEFFTVPDPLPNASRLHKLALEPIPGDALPSHRYETVWMQQFPGIVGYRELRFFDLTGDGTDEIILSHAPRGDPEVPAFSILDLEGTILYQSPWNTGSSIAIGDVQGDGQNEVVALLNQEALDDPDRYWEPWSHLVGVQWVGGKFRETYDFPIDDEYGGHLIVLCDLDDDGADEVLLALGEPMRDGQPGHGIMKIFKQNGDLLWEYGFPYGQPRHPRIDDFTGDGNYDIILGTSATQLFVFSPGENATGAGGPQTDPYHAFLETNNLKDLENVRPEDVSAATSDLPSATVGLILILSAVATLRTLQSRHRP